MQTIEAALVMASCCKLAVMARTRHPRRTPPVSIVAVLYARLSISTPLDEKPFGR